MIPAKRQQISFNAVKNNLNAPRECYGQGLVFMVVYGGCSWVLPPMFDPLELQNSSGNG
jgi:hypothetical protein